MGSGIDNGGKRGPGRPKGSGGRKRKGRRSFQKAEKTVVVLPPSATELRVPPYFAAGLQNKTSPTNSSIPSLQGISGPGKRGPGRPKKTPPTLEPILPLEKVGLKNKKDDRTANPLKGSIIKPTCMLSSKISKGVVKDIKENLKINKVSDIHPIIKSGSKSRISRLPTKLCLKSGLRRVKQHKHKKRRKIIKELEVDPKFFSDLEKLATEFEKSCFISSNSHKPTSNGLELPAIFRVKRIIKKRKGSERSAKASDKDSGAEGETAHKEKSALVTSNVTQPTLNSAKRRIKKSTVEVPKVKYYLF
jgi:hypothetical protein